MHNRTKSNTSGRTAGRRWVRTRGKGGVSDIIGTILILAITVTLFSSIFFFVTTLPGPAGQSTSQFSASLGTSTGGKVVDVNITYITGPSLGGSVNDIYVTSTPTTCGFSNPYSISTGLSGASNWAAGQTWVLAVPTPSTCSSSGLNITISIVNFQTNVLLFNVVLPGSSANPPPEFLAEGYSPDPVVSEEDFYVWAQIHDTSLKSNSIYASFSQVPGATPASGSWAIASCDCMNLSLDSTTGTWVMYLEVYTDSASVLGNSYAVTINATDKLGQTNSVVLDVSFTSSEGIEIEASLSASPGNPTIGENTTITAELSNLEAEGGTATLEFSATHGTWCDSQTTCTQKKDFNYTEPIDGYASDDLVAVYWNAQGANSIGDGSAIITLSISLPSESVSPLDLTVYPKTVLVDGTGISIGSSGDPFTYLTTDFTSANVPYSYIVAPPGSSTVTYDVNTESTDLSQYNLVIWDAGNATGSSNCLSSQDALAFGDALNAGIGSWMIGADVFSSSACSTASDYTTYLGASASSVTQTSAATALSSPSSASVPTIGYPSSLELAPNGYYAGLTVASGASYLKTSGGTIVASSNPASSPRANAFSSSFDMTVLDTTVNGGTYSSVATGTGPQASLVFDAFNWLAGFVASGPSNSVSGTDWAVSQVSVVPTSPSYESSSYVNVTVRNNGLAGGQAVEAILLVDGVPYPTSGAPDHTYITPAKQGGAVEKSINWQPDVIGYVTIGVEIDPPSNDSNADNNIMYSSLFDVETYVGYSVLIVDNSQYGLSGSTGPNITKTQILPALEAAGFSASTINETYIKGICGTLAINPDNYNLVVWSDGTATASWKPGGTSYCPLTNTNAATLANFLVAGGTQSSLLFLGGGLMTLPSANTTATTFVQTYLGTTVTATTASAAPTSIIGRTSDSVGNGNNIALASGGSTANNYTCAPTGSGEVSYYYNGSIDYWTSGSCAGVDTTGSTGWHSAYWGWNLAGTSNQNRLDLGVLRAATFFGRLLPKANAIVDTPDITFGQVSSSYINFDSMHPQIDDQYLVEVNVTNLGGDATSSVGISVFDGSHILSSQTVAVSASTENSTTGVVTFGIASTSVPWVPIYAGTNEITVEVTTSTASQALPNVGILASGNLTVYFFYDLSNNNLNDWSHSQTILQQVGFNPQSCDENSAGLSVYLWDNTSVPRQWPAFSGCSPAAPGAVAWGIDTTAGYCYITTEGGCSSLAISDADTANSNNECTIGHTTYTCGYVDWTFTNAISVPANSTGLTSATATWEQKYDFAESANGGIVCITTSKTNFVSGGYGADLNEANTCDSSTPSPTPTDAQTNVDIYNSDGVCNVIPAFTGASDGGTFGWSAESMNLSNYAGKTIYLAFGYVQGGWSTCDGITPTAVAGDGWYIDNFQVSVSESTSSPAYTNSNGDYTVPSDLWGIYTSSQLSTVTGSGSGETAAGAPPTGYAWVDAAWDGSTTVLDANMWDALTSRPIDLTSAVNANLTFNYLWSGIEYVTAYECDYVFVNDPSQGMVLDVEIANSGNWVPVWSSLAQNYGGTCGTSWQYPIKSVGNTYSDYNVYEANAYISSDIAEVSTWGWRPAYVNLNGYVGNDIQLRFLVGTNDGNPGSSTGPTDNCYPMMAYSSGNTCSTTVSSESPLASGGFISGIYIRGNTSTVPGTGPTLIAPPVTPRAGDLAPRYFRTLAVTPLGIVSEYLDPSPAGAALSPSTVTVPFSDTGALVAAPVGPSRPQ